MKAFAIATVLVVMFTSPVTAQDPVKSIPDIKVEARTRGDNQDFFLVGKGRNHREYVAFIGAGRQANTIAFSALLVHIPEFGSPQIKDLRDANLTLWDASDRNQKKLETYNISVSKGDGFVFKIPSKYLQIRALSLEISP